MQSNGYSCSLRASGPARVSYPAEVGPACLQLLTSRGRGGCASPGDAGFRGRDASSPSKIAFRASLRAAGSASPRQSVDYFLFEGFDPKLVALELARP
jgi:hypothetical protein